MHVIAWLSTMPEGHHYINKDKVSTFTLLEEFAMSVGKNTSSNHAHSPFGISKSGRKTKQTPGHIIDFSQPSCFPDTPLDNEPTSQLSTTQAAQPHVYPRTAIGWVKFWGLCLILHHLQHIWSHVTCYIKPWNGYQEFITSKKMNHQ